MNILRSKCSSGHQHDSSRERKSGVLTASINVHVKSDIRPQPLNTHQLQLTYISPMRLFISHTKRGEGCPRHCFIASVVITIPWATELQYKITIDNHIAVTARMHFPSLCPAGKLWSLWQKPIACLTKPWGAIVHFYDPAHPGKEKGSFWQLFPSISSKNNFCHHC